MLMNAKVIKLDLNYSCAEHHHFAQQRHYLAPYPEEPAEHFARRVLAWLHLYESKPVMAGLHRTGKDPDVFIQDEQQHFQLWASVELLEEKYLRRACHLADQVVLFLSPDEQRQLTSMPYSAKSSSCVFQPEQLQQLCTMFQSHMELSVWREDDTILLTDGKQHLELTVQCQHPH
ncbi:YaeQ family protein [Alkalimonas sp. MEB108]|uniref:YaeQ family protein n=1 Tax=Alkalimonas cellulosilytica TaxID=3058395 RepID=A0ABU7J3J7_9GAMM|nr:YaeQ family protein [Alkalimonas sp. MEB108]MEE2000590.1 YaeQ family protein [Alkalimonas sp. MEB108]